MELVSEEKVFHKQDEILFKFRFMQNTSETSVSQEGKIDIFAKGIVHDFGQKVEAFSSFVFIKNRWRKSVC